MKETLFFAAIVSLLIIPIFILIYILSGVWLGIAIVTLGMSYLLILKLIFYFDREYAAVAGMLLGIPVILLIIWGLVHIALSLIEEHSKISINKDLPLEYKIPLLIILAIWLFYPKHLVHKKDNTRDKR